MGATEADMKEGTESHTGEVSENTKLQINVFTDDGAVS